MHWETESVCDAPEEAPYEVYHICVFKYLHKNIIQVYQEWWTVISSSLEKTNEWLINFINFLNEIKVWLKGNGNKHFLCLIWKNI